MIKINRTFDLHTLYSHGVSAHFIIALQSTTNPLKHDLFLFSKENSTNFFFETQNVAKDVLIFLFTLFG